MWNTCICGKHNLLKDLNFIIIILFYTKEKDFVLKRFFFFLNYHSWLTNSNISKNIRKIKNIHPFHGSCVTYHIKFKLLYKFRIITFFFPNISIMSILLKLEI